MLILNLVKFNVRQDLKKKRPLIYAHNTKTVKANHNYIQSIAKKFHNDLFIKSLNCLTHI